jgi:hypothetical protein
MFGSRRRRRSLLHRRAIVSLKSGSAFRGVLFDHRGDLYVLKDTEFLEVGRGAVRMDGDVVVDLDAVDFIQLVPALPPPPIGA